MRCVAFGNHTRKNIIPERVAYSIGYDMQRGESDGPPSRRCLFLYRILLRELPSSWPTRPTRSATTFMITAIIKNVIFRRQVGQWRIAVLECQANHDVGRTFRRARPSSPLRSGRAPCCSGEGTGLHRVHRRCTDGTLDGPAPAACRLEGTGGALAGDIGQKARRPPHWCADGALAGRRLVVRYLQTANGRPPPRGTTPPACDSRG